MSQPILPVPEAQVDPGRPYKPLEDEKARSVGEALLCPVNAL